MLSQRQTAWKTRLLTAAFFVLILLLTYGFPVTGDDWFFTPRRSDGNLLRAVQTGVNTAKKHFYTTNGRYIGNFFAGAMGTSKLLRESVRGGFIFGVFLAACRFCGLRGNTERLLCLTLLIALPAGIFAQSYAWAAGFFNYVPPTLPVLLYLHEAVEALSQNRRVSQLRTVGLFLLGFATQFFTENVTVALCLLSAAVCVVCSVRRKRFVPQLAAHTAGAVLGCVLMFLAPGYRNIGTEAYREIPQGLFGLLRNAMGNFGVMINELLLKNPLLLGLMTLLCLLLLRRAAAGKGRTRTTLALIASAVGLVLCRLLLPPLLDVPQAASAALVLQFVLALSALLWAAGVTAAVWLGVPERTERLRILLLLGGAVLFLAPLLVVQPIGPRCLYLPNVLMLCAVLCMLRVCCGEGLRPLLRRCVCIGACMVLGAFLWITVCNGAWEKVRVNYTEEQIAAGATHITLPQYPYEDYVFGVESDAIMFCYYRNEPMDISFSLVPIEEWCAESGGTENMP